MTLTTTPTIGSSCAVRERHGIAPNLLAQGTGLSFAGSAAGPASAAAQVAVAGVRTTDLTGLLPRGAPV